MPITVGVTGALRVLFSRRELIYHREAGHRAHFLKMKMTAKFGIDYPKAHEDASKLTMC